MSTEYSRIIYIFKITLCSCTNLRSHDTTIGDEHCGSSMATATLGTLQEFKPEVETFTAYLEHLQAYYGANDVPSGKRSAVLLSVIGPKTYSILRKFNGA